MLRISIFAGAVLALAAPAAAQSTDQMVATIATLARDNLERARLPDGEPVPAETAEERSRPIVPPALDQKTVRRGALTAQLQACGGQWEEASYLPYMAQLRASGRYSDKQLAYVALVHGITQQMVLDSLSSREEPCPDSARQAVAAALAN